MPAFTMPQLGESDVEGTVLRWLKQPGEHVRAEEPLVEVETEKVTVEIPSPFEGILSRVLVQEGETVPVGAPLAMIGDEVEVGEVPAAPTATPAQPPVAAAPDARPAEPVGAAPPARPTPPDLAAERTVFGAREAAAAGAVHPSPATVAPPSGDGRNGAIMPRGAEGRYSPAVLRLAAEHHIDLSAVPGTGMEGRVTRKDVLRYVESRGAGGAAAPAVAGVSRTAGVAAGAPVGAADTAAPPIAAPAPPPSQPIAEPAPAQAPSPAAPRAAAQAAARAEAPASPDEEIIKPSATRLTIARNMLRSAQTIPTAWMVVEVDVTRLVRLREGLKEAFRRREGVDLSYLPFVIKATVESLKEHPLLNSQWRDDQIVLKKRINMGIAVGSDEGLIVPVIHNADRLSIAGLAHAVVDLAQRARARKLRLEDVQGGTFTLDNTGVFGSIVSQPIINPPQCAILSTEAIVKRPVIVEDAIAIRSLMNMCISFDHRIVDGSHVGPFMQSLKRRLEAFGPETSVY